MVTLLFQNSLSHHAVLSGDTLSAIMKHISSCSVCLHVAQVPFFLVGNQFFVKPSIVHLHHFVITHFVTVTQYMIHFLQLFKLAASLIFKRFLFLLCLTIDVASMNVLVYKG